MTPDLFSRREFFTSLLGTAVATGLAAKILGLEEAFAARSSYLAIAEADEYILAKWRVGGLVKTAQFYAPRAVLTIGPGYDMDCEVSDIVSVSWRYGQLRT